MRTSEKDRLQACPKAKPAVGPDFDRCPRGLIADDRDPGTTVIDVLAEQCQDIKVLAFFPPSILIVRAATALR